MGLSSRILSTLLLLATGAVSEALEWKQHAGYRIAPLDFPTSNRVGFTQVSALKTGIQFTNLLASSTAITNQIYLNGSGVALGDIDGDSDVDIYFSALESENQLYINLGNWTFAKVSDQPALRCANQASTGAVFADVDGDADNDLLVSGIRSGTRLFLNDGRGHFTENTDKAGLRSSKGSTSMTLADVNGDSWIDLYVVNYRNKTMRDEPDSPFDVRIKDGQYELVSYRGRPADSPDLQGRFSFDRNSGVMENGEADQLFLNNGDGSFYLVAWDEGVFVSAHGETITAPYDWGLSAMFRDLNGDRWPDLYVCNDFQSPDRIWINDGAGSFLPIHDSAIRQTSLFSMGVDIADIDRDGLEDLFVVDMLSRRHLDRHTQVMDEAAFAQYRTSDSLRPQSPRNTLLKQMANGNYHEIARYAKVDSSYWSWTPAFVDVDLDGYEDLLITTGHGRDAQNVDISRDIDSQIASKKRSPRQQLELRKAYPELIVPNVAFRNQQNLTFSETGDDWGFNSLNISHGLALADLDNDGDLDAVVNCLNAPPLLLRNDGSQARLHVRLVGEAPNTSSIGTYIELETQNLPSQTHEVSLGGRYLSSDDPAAVFAMGRSSNTASLKIHWRDGSQTQIENLPANHAIEIHQSDSENLSLNLGGSEAATRPPLFQDVSNSIPHQHVDRPFEEATIQAGVERKLSENGPGVSWFDFNRDGWEDLLIGAGRGGKMGVYRNAGNGSFVKQRAKAFETPVRRDQTTLLGWEPGGTERLLLIGQSNLEDPQPQSPGLWQFSVVTGKSDQSLVNIPGSIGPLAMADIDLDQDLDLFVGGAITAGHYPLSPPSYLLKNENGKLSPADKSATIPTLNGEVRAALFTNLIEDQAPELIVVGNWMPIRMFKNDTGNLVPWDPQVRLAPSPHPQPEASRLSELTGWWNSVASGDFDGDGRMDLVIGNWGENLPSLGSSKPSRRLYYEVSETGSRRLISSYFNDLEKDWYPMTPWGTASNRFSELRSQYTSFAQFGSASMTDLLQNGLPRMKHLTSSFFKSIVLLNRIDHFVIKPLPSEVQFSPIFGLGVGDFDADGTQDLVINQNFHSVSQTDGRQDAGSISFLKGTGLGEFKYVDTHESGLWDSEQGRGLAVCDFDHDGRLDFVSTQNNGPIRVYRNQAKSTGLRVQLEGPRKNFQAIGTRVRLVYRNGKKGPLSEIHLGSGYWSQHASTLVLGSPDQATAIEIWWPDGKHEKIPLSENAKVFAHKYPQ